MPIGEELIIGEDLNGHIEKSINFNQCRRFGYGARNERGEKTLEFINSYDLVIANTENGVIEFIRANTDNS